MKRLLPGMRILLPLLLLLSSQTQAQDRLITGVVRDVLQNAGIANATVNVKGTGIGTSTAEDGSFRLNVPASATTLVISSVGFTTREVPITSGPITITLTGTNTALNEVIVVGYGTQRSRCCHHFPRLPVAVVTTLQRLQNQVYLRKWIVQACCYN